MEKFENTLYKCYIEKDITKDNAIILNMKYDEDVGGNEITYKFKDPRDTLNFLLKNWRLISPVESMHLYDHIELGYHLGIYTQIEIYYMLLLEQQLYFNLRYSMNYPLPDIYYNRNTSVESKFEVLNLLKDYEKKLNEVTRIAHKFAVKNTWLFWNIQKNNIKFNPFDSENLFDEEYKGKKVDYVLSFNLYHRLWTVYFKDGSWIIASDVGNGWYAALTDFNSYKLIGRS